jgi:hypothetical protein
MMKSRSVLVAIIAMLASGLSHAADLPVHGSGNISLDEAKSLVEAAVPAKLKRLPKFGLDQFKDGDRPRFYFFTAEWEGLPNGSVVIGNYAVDQRTGDVWDAVTSCDELSTPVLRKLQSKIRLRIGLSAAEYHRIKSNGPLCD